ncbi:hypothetical protein AH06_01765 [candidate division TM6 bacterium Zodletone_IIa]|jgi:fermentation-respiration switch protein FrsA (DUF1100 family)|nr:hypothetical protein AH06_01765 [candidate division TM6 bacterium Zodletone_IIa]
MSSQQAMTSKHWFPATIQKAFNYLIAPFKLSEWKKSAQEAKGKAKQEAKKTLMLLGIYYVLFSPLVAMPFYNTCIFHPYVTGDYEIKEIAGVKKQDVYFENSQHTKLHAWYFANPAAKKTILFSHGNAGNITHRTEILKLLINSGASVFIYDYSGFGLSKGSPSVDGCIDDAIAAFDTMKNKLKIDPQSIVLYGESLGTGITSQLAEHRNCSGVILQSAFASLPEIAREKMIVFRLYPDFIYPVNKLNTKAYVKGQHPPLLIIHGEKDNIIPVHNADDIYAAASQKKSLVKLPEASHNDVPDHATYDMGNKLAEILR